MPVINRIAEFSEDMTAWRRHLHAHPEFGLDCHKTAQFVVDQLTGFGITDIHTGIGTSGLVALIDGQGDGPTIGLRADMDALPMQEATGLPHASTVDGMMHACGHDGHTTMLLGAAKYLAETRNFSGRVALIFQPAEENFGGAKYMCDEGMMERFDIREVYALHNMPNQPLGQFTTMPGAIMAAEDAFDVTVTGKGGHAAYLGQAVDPIIAVVSMVQALQSIVTRELPSAEELVLAVTQIHGGTADNIVPEQVVFGGTVRCFSTEIRDQVERRLREIIAGQATSFGVSADVAYRRGYPPTVNTADATAKAVEVARHVSGDALVDANGGREMGSEDFAYMLERRPGAFLFLGQGEGAGLHHPEYDFSDAVAPYGASFFARLVESVLPRA